jgi:hypothetical protein
MITTLDLLELVKKTYENCSDYRAAQLLEISRQTPSTWIHRGSVMDDKTAIKAALLCNLDPEYVLACIAAERAKDSDAFPHWEHIAGRLAPRKSSPLNTRSHAA